MLSGLRRHRGHKMHVWSRLVHILPNFSSVPEARRLGSHTDLHHPLNSANFAVACELDSSFIMVYTRPSILATRIDSLQLFNVGYWFGWRRRCDHLNSVLLCILLRARRVKLLVTVRKVREYTELDSALWTQSCSAYSRTQLGGCGEEMGYGVCLSV